MIGKQVKGRDFGGCLRYVLEKEGAEHIGGNLLGTTIALLVFQLSLAVH